MAMREYQVVVNGVTTTMQLSETDADRVGVTKATGGDPGTVTNKARSTEAGLSSTGTETSRRGGGKRARTKNDDTGDDE